METNEELKVMVRDLSREVSILSARNLLYRIQLKRVLRSAIIECRMAGADTKSLRKLNQELERVLEG